LQKKDLKEFAIFFCLKVPGGRAEITGALLFFFHFTFKKFFKIVF